MPSSRLASAVLLLATCTAAAPDPQWSDRFATPGIDGPVYCAAPYRGGIAVGGRFSFVAGTPAHNVAFWDGAHWQALGTGTDGIVTSLIAYGNDLVVSGQFERAGGSAAHGVASYHDGSWSAMGAGFSRSNQLGPAWASALAIYRGEIYAYGDFDHSGATPLQCVARWDGKGWMDVGGGVDTNSAGPMVVLEDRLYLGGAFAHAGGVPANGIARWDGIAWSALDSGVRTNGQAAQVRTMTAFDGGLAVGGDFDSAGTVAAQNVALWKGSAWSGLGEGSPGEVRAMIAVANGLLLGPTFGVNSRLWNGHGWVDPTPSGLNGTAYGFVDFGGPVAYGDIYNDAGGSISSSNLLRAEGDAWRGFEAFSERTNGILPLYRITALARDSRGILAGGAFPFIGSAQGWLSTDDLARWDGTRWQRLPPIPFYGSIGAIMVRGDTIDVGGTFYEFGHGPWWIRPVVRLVGSTWTALDTLSLSATSMRMYQGSLVIGGARASLSDPDQGGAYRWDGTRWVSIGTFADAGRFKRVHAMAEHDGRLVVGGGFESIDGVAANCIAEWDGHSWTALGAGPGRVDGLNAVYSLAVYRHQLIAAGEFGNPGYGIQSWDGANWAPVGDRAGFGDALTVSDDELIAVIDDEVAGWDGTTWQELGSTRGMVNAMLADEGGVYFGGSFTELGGQPAVGFGRWTRDNSPPVATTLSSGWPNPFRESVAFAYQSRAPGTLHLFVRDVNGRRIATVEQSALSAGTGLVQWDGRDDAGSKVPAGIYFVTLATADGARDTRKIVLVP